MSLNALYLFVAGESREKHGKYPKEPKRTLSALSKAEQEKDKGCLK